jgi:hypothetical protein
MQILQVLFLLLACIGCGVAAFRTSTVPGARWHTGWAGLALYFLSLVILRSVR